MIGFLRRWRITWRGYSFGPGRYIWPEHHGRHIRKHLRAEARRLAPPTPHQQIVQQVIRDHLEWRAFVQAHMWAGACPDCIVVVNEPSEAEDAVAVWSPCPAHALGDRRWTQ